MGRTCFVKKCRSGYRSNPEKVSFFRPPKDPSLLDEWKTAISRFDRELSTTDVVCEKHFDESDIIKTWQCVTKDGSVLMEGQRRAKLKKDAIPRFFPAHPKYSTQITPKLRTIAKKGTQSLSAKQAAFVIFMETNEMRDPDFEVEEILGI